MNKNFLLVIVLSLLALIYSIYFIFESNQKDFEDRIFLKIERKDFILKRYLNNAKYSLYTLNDSFKKNLEVFEKKDYSHPIFKYLCFRNNNITHYTKVVLDKKQNIYASINGLKSSLEEDTKKEMISLLYLNPIFKNSIIYIDNLLWIYYTSNKNFIYLAPTEIEMNDNFIYKLYEKSFWTDALLENNPNKDLIITDIYLDYANKGLMTTLSLPVYFNDTFKGVFSIDIGLDTILNIINKNINYGELNLIKSDNTILSLKDTSNLKQKLSYENKKDTFFIELITFDKKLKFVYTIDKYEKNLIILKESFPYILISLFIFITVNIIFYLLFLTKKIKLLSNIDPLTKLLNRRAMEEKINTLIDISKRYEQEISFLMLDLDNFKRINDTYGHRLGDITLIEVSKILEKNCRKADLISRYGGEEFLICLSNTELHSAYKLAERIRIDVSKLKIPRVDKQITVSIGCAEHIFEEDIEKTIDRADKLLYEAKVNGKNQTLTGIRF